MFRAIILSALFVLFCGSFFCGCVGEKKDESAFGPYPDEAVNEELGPYPVKKRNNGPVRKQSPKN